MLRCNAQPYEGSKPYVFVSYSHEEEDKAIVYPILERMEQAGFRLWYDLGIESTSEWPKVIGEHLEKATAVLFCFSKNFTASSNCLDELFYAKDNIPNRITLFMDSKQKLAVELQLALSRQQKIYLENYNGTAELVASLKKEKEMQPCLGATSPAQKAMKLNMTRIGRELQDENFLAAKQAYKACEIQKAMDLYRTAYANGNGIAGTLLAAMYLNGYYFPKDYDRAVQIFVDCMHRDNPIATEMLASCYLSGHGVPKDEEKARALFAGCQDALEEMAIFGSEDAQYRLGHDLLRGIFTTSSPERGVYWLQKAAETGSDLARHQLAVAKLNGLGCPKDVDAAIREFNLCKSNPHCAYLLADLLQKGADGIKKNDNTALELLLYAAKRGHIQAQSDLGDCYYEGKGTRVDYAQAILWYQKAADKGDRYSIGHLGMQYLLAKGVPRNTDKAISFFEQNNEKGGPYGARMLGYIYCGLYDGDCSYKDLPKAVRYLKKSADGGDKPARKQLMDCYSGKLGKEVQDLPRYGAMLQESANQNDMDSIEKLLDYYSGNLGKEVQDMPMYYRTLQKAADLGYIYYKYRLGCALVEGAGEPTLPKDPDKGNALIDEAVKNKNLNAMLYRFAQAISAEVETKQKNAVFLTRNVISTILETMRKMNLQDKDIPTDYLLRLGNLYLSLVYPGKIFSVISEKNLTRDERHYLGESYRYFFYALCKDETLHDALYWLSFLQFTYGFKNDTWDNAALLDRLKKEVPNDPDFALRLGNYYRDHGNEDAMLYWYKMAYSSSRSAAHNLGRYCIDHNTHITDALEALEPWADIQDPTATYLLGRIYRNGIGVPKDRAKAKALLRKAADLGSKEAAAELRTFWF